MQACEQVSAIILHCVEHHIQPQTYLRGFRDPAMDARMGPRLWAIDLQYERISSRSPRGIAKRTDYYAVYNIQLPTHCFETDFLSRMENDGAPILVKVRDGNFALSYAERSHLAYFIALLYARTPASREGMAHVSAKMLEAIASKRARDTGFAAAMREANKAHGLSDERIEELRRLFIAPGSIRYEVIPEFTLLQILYITDSLARIIFRMGWHFAIAPLGKHFVTSDNPVFWHDPTAPWPYCNGIASRNVILTFPIGPEVALVASWRDTSDSSYRMETSIMDCLNGTVVASADRWLIAARREEAEAALRLRREMKRGGARLGPRRVEISANDLRAVLR